MRFFEGKKCWIFAIFFTSTPSWGRAGKLVAPCPFLLGQVWFSNRSTWGLHFVGQDRDWALLKCFGAVLVKSPPHCPSLLGHLCFLNETQKCKFFRCGSEVIRGFPSKIGFGTKTEPFWTSTRQRHPPNQKVFWWTPSFFHQHSTRQTHPANTLIFWLFAHLGEPGQGGWIFPPVYSFCNGKIILGLWRHPSHSENSTHTTLSRPGHLDLKWENIISKS